MATGTRMGTPWRRARSLPSCLVAALSDGKNDAAGSTTPSVLNRQGEMMNSSFKRAVFGLLVITAVLTVGLLAPPRLSSQSTVPGSVLLGDDFNDGVPDGWT